MQNFEETSLKNSITCLEKINNFYQKFTKIFWESFWKILEKFLSFRGYNIKFLVKVQRKCSRKFDETSKKLVEILIKKFSPKVLENFKEILRSLEENKKKIFNKIPKTF